jgi:sulfur carrier protein
VTSVTLNGEPRELAEPATVEAALAAAGVPEPGHGVAVAVDGEVVRRSAWSAIELRDGQSVEVLRAVQGG